MARLLLALILNLATDQGWAASCCGQSPSSFAVLTSGQSLNVVTGFSSVHSQGRIFDDSSFYEWDDKQRRVQSVQLSIAGTLAEHHQMFLTSSFLQGTYSDATESGSAQHLSDVQLGYSYEVLPEYSFSYWKPNIFVSAIVNLPTGKSIYDTNSLSEGTDVTGHNQWGAGLGLTVKKVYFPLTITLQAKALRLFAKEFQNTDVSGFFDNSAALVFNYATGFKDISVNAGATTSQLTSRKINPGELRSGESLNSTLMVGLQKQFGETWTAGLSYADQTLLGPARNSILSRTYSLNLTYNKF